MKDCLLHDSRALKKASEKLDKKICDNALTALNYTFENHEEFKSKAKILMNENKEKFTLNKMIDKLDSIMGSYLKDQPTQVKLKLPKLKKVMETS